MRGVIFSGLLLLLAPVSQAQEKGFTQNYEVELTSPPSKGYFDEKFFLMNCDGQPPTIWRAGIGFSSGPVPGNRTYSTAGDEDIEIDQRFGFSDDCGIGRLYVETQGHRISFYQDDLSCKKFRYVDFANIPIASFRDTKIQVAALDCDTTPKCRKAVFEATYSSKRGAYVWQQAPILFQGYQPCSEEDIQTLFYEEEDPDLYNKHRD